MLTKSSKESGHNFYALPWHITTYRERVISSTLLLPAYILLKACIFPSCLDRLGINDKSAVLGNTFPSSATILLLPLESCLFSVMLCNHNEGIYPPANKPDFSSLI